MIYTNDHGLPHVHAVGPGASAKISLISGAVISFHGFNEATLNRLVKFVKENRENFLEEWDAIHG